MKYIGETLRIAGNQHWRNGQRITVALHKSNIRRQQLVIDEANPDLGSLLILFDADKKHLLALIKRGDLIAKQEFYRVQLVVLNTLRCPDHGCPTGSQCCACAQKSV